MNGNVRYTLEWNKKQCLVIAGIINLILVGITLGTTNIYYLTGDEYWFSLILSGAEGNGYEAYTAFLNIPLPLSYSSTFLSQKIS